jgi:hypothetical protein
MLPESAEILEHNYYFREFQRLVAKISLDEADYEELAEKLLDYAEAHGIAKLENYNFVGIGIRNEYAHWWDLDIENIVFEVSCETYSRAHIEGFTIYANLGMPKIHVFMTVNEDGEHFLYVYH